MTNGSYRGGGDGYSAYNESVDTDNFLHERSSMFSEFSEVDEEDKEFLRAVEHLLDKDDGFENK